MLEAVDQQGDDLGENALFVEETKDGVVFFREFGRGGEEDLETAGTECTKGGCQKGNERGGEEREAHFVRSEEKGDGDVEEDAEMVFCLFSGWGLIDRGE